MQHQELLDQTRITLAKARDESTTLQAQAEILEIKVLELRNAASLAQQRVAKLSNVLAILEGRDVEPVPVPQAVSAPAPQVPVPAAPQVEYGGSVAEQAAAAAAAGDPLANRTADFGDPQGRGDADAPPSSNRPPPGPACPGCGRPGSMAQTQIMVGDRGPFPAVVCTNCGHQKAMI